MQGMIQTAKVDFALSHSGSFPLSEAVRGKAGVGIHGGVRRKTMGDGRKTGAGEGKESGCLSKSEEGGCDLSGTKKPVLKNSRNSLCPKFIRIFYSARTKILNVKNLRLAGKVENWFQK